MNTLPIDAVNIILEYQGYHTYRHGKYIKKIDNNDERYKLLKTIPKIKKNKYGTYELCFWKTIIHTNETNNKKCFINNIHTLFFQKQPVCKKNICFMIETIVNSSDVLWVMNVEKYHDCNESYDDRDRTQFIINS